MLGSLASLLIFFAQAPPAAAGGKQDSVGLLQYVPYIAVLPILWFMLIRPQQQQDAKRRALMDGLKKNDKVLTASGIYGTVISVDEKGERVQLRLDDDGKVKVTFTRASIVRIMGDPSEKAAETK